MAKRILADRTLNGPFQHIDDLERVSGIGPKTLAKIRSYILPISADADLAAAQQDRAASKSAKRDND